MRGCWFLIGCLLFTAFLEARVIRLKSNLLLQGEVVEHFADGILFKRWDTGGLIQLNWEHLNRQDSEALKKEFGYVLQEERLVTRKASRVFLKNGSYLDGRVQGDLKKEAKIRFQNATSRLVLSANEIHRIVPIEMNILDMYTQDEIYQDYLSRHNLNTAYAEFEFADFLRNLQLYELAIEHYKRAQEKDSAYETKVRALVENLEALLKDKELQKDMASIYGQINQNKFKEAFTSIEVLQEKYASNSQATSLLTKAKEDAEKRRDEFLTKKVPYAYYHLVRSLLQTKTHQRKVSLSEARSYADSELDKEILQKLAERYQIEEELIENAFEARPLTTNKKASYNSGSFIQGLGTESKGTGSSMGGSGGVGLEQQISEFLNKNREGRSSRSGGGSSSSDTLQSSEEWWNSTTASSRYQWLLAYYGERKMKVQDYYLKTCGSCAGRGFSITSSVAGQKKQTCKRCHGLKYDKGVLFK